MTSRNRIWLALGLALLFGSRLVSAEPGETNAPASMRKGDAFLIRIEGLGGELPEYREIVDSEGKIELPFLGFFSAEGKRPADVEAEMAAAYANAKLSTNVVVHLTFITHFDPPPPRQTLIRSQDPRRPVPAVPPAAAE